MTDQDVERFASRRLADLLRAEIEEGGKYPPGSRLPSYRQLRTEHRVALNTAQAAVRLLASEGLVEVRPASGAFVRDRTADPIDVRAELAGLLDRLRQAQQDLGTAERAVAGLLTRLQGGDRAG